MNSKNEKIPSGYYVYMILDPFTPNLDIPALGVKLPHCPIYLGKGKNKRIFDHLREASSPNIPQKANKHKIYAIQNILKRGGEPIHCVIKSNLTDEEALNLEGVLGDTVGYRFDNTGPLTNLIKTGVKAPVLIGDKNPFFGKKHSQKTKDEIARKYKIWYSGLSEEQKEIINDKRRCALKGRTFSKLQIEQRLKSRWGADYRDKMAVRAAEKQIRRQKRAEQRNAVLLEKESKLASTESMKADGVYWKTIRGGSKNPMYGQGHKLAGCKNGRSKVFLICVSGYTFKVNANIKGFIAAFKTHFNTGHPFIGSKKMQRFNITKREFRDSDEEIAYIDFEGIETFSKHGVKLP